MKKKAAHQESKSLKTFYLYAAIVLLFICISLIIKGFFILQQSKFDGFHQITLAITNQGNVKEIIAFHPQTPAISQLVITDKNISYAALAKSYGIATDGYVQVDTPIASFGDVTSFMWASVTHTTTWQSDLTVFDKIRLMLLAKSVTTNNKSVEALSLTKQSAQTDTMITNALTDQDLASENISIQVINATDVSGFGQRLGRVLTNMGANVVDVSSAQNTKEHTTIAYFGNDSYTVKRLEKLLGVKLTKLTKQSIANVIITIGQDRQQTNAF